MNVLIEDTLHIEDLQSGNYERSKNKKLLE